MADIELTYQVGPGGIRSMRYKGSVEDYFAWRDNIIIGDDWAIVAEFEALQVIQSEPTDQPLDSD